MPTQEEMIQAIQEQTDTIKAEIITAINEGKLASTKNQACIIYIMFDGQNTPLIVRPRQVKEANKNAPPLYGDALIESLKNDPNKALANSITLTLIPEDTDQKNYIGEGQSNRVFKTRSAHFKVEKDEFLTLDWKPEKEAGKGKIVLKPKKTEILQPVSQEIVNLFYEKPAYVIRDAIKNAYEIHPHLKGEPLDKLYPIPTEDEILEKRKEIRNFLTNQIEEKNRTHHNLPGIPPLLQSLKLHDRSGIPERRFSLKINTELLKKITSFVKSGMSLGDIKNNQFSFSEKVLNKTSLLNEEFKDEIIKISKIEEKLNLLQINLLQNKKIKIIESAFQSLFVLHAKGLVHGDINMGNILFDDETNTCRFVDPGLARKIGEKDHLSGTPIYFAPELQIARKNDINTKVSPPILPSRDVYSLALFSINLLLGDEKYEQLELYFEIQAAQTRLEIEVLTKQQNKSLINALYEKEIDLTIITFLEKCLDIDPNNRPSEFPMPSSPDNIQEEGNSGNDSSSSSNSYFSSSSSYSPPPSYVPLTRNYSSDSQSDSPDSDSDKKDGFLESSAQSSPSSASDSDRFSFSQSEDDRIFLSVVPAEKQPKYNVSRSSLKTSDSESNAGKINFPSNSSSFFSKPKQPVKNNSAESINRFITIAAEIALTSITIGAFLGAALTIIGLAMAPTLALGAGLLVFSAIATLAAAISLAQTVKSETQDKTEDKIISPPRGLAR